MPSIIPKIVLGLYGKAILFIIEDNSLNAIFGYGPLFFALTRDAELYTVF